MSFSPWSAQFFHRELWTTDLATLTLWSRFQVRCLRLAIVVVEEFQANLLNLRAMSLVYSTLLSLVPLLAVTFSVLKAFGVHNQIEPLLTQALEPLGSKGADLAWYMLGFVSNLRVGLLGAVGVAGLFFTVISLIGQIEDALNHIWRLRYPRPLARKFSDYLSVVLVGPVLVFSAFALTASAQSSWLVQYLLSYGSLSLVITMVTRVMPLLFLCIVFTFLYKFLPNTRVPLRSAMIAGVTAGLLWQVAGLGFARFVASSTRYTVIYSSFAVLLLFLIWVYVGWLIVLVGGEVAYLHQNGHLLVRWRRRRDRNPLSRVRLAFLFLTTITRRYLTQEPLWRLTELAATLEVSPVDLEDLIDEFVRRRILLRSLEPEGLALGRPPEGVAVSEILDAIETIEEPPGTKEDAVSLILERREQAIRQALAGLTLHSLCSEESVRKVLASDEALFSSVPSAAASRVPR
ncbi:MAG: YihY family inner membrane protein [Deltaproteobacteria bacterium]|nr:YihY family inner membrane protein [Deltaproteobacteria bacterium]